MRIIGLTAEYNPFHRGHAWQLARIRERFGSDAAVVTVLSGCFVQRGEPALFDAHARAEADFVTRDMGCNIWKNL